MEIMNLCVLHLSDIERESGTGVDREELIQWYLEQREMDFEREEDLDHERELIAKALTKLAKVSRSVDRACLAANIMDRIITFSKSEGMYEKAWRHQRKAGRWSRLRRAGATRSITLFVSTVFFSIWFPFGPR